MADGAKDADRRFQEALDRAFKFLSRRERTEAQVLARLERDGVEQPLAAEVVVQLVADGYLSDERYAVLYAEDRRSLDGWGNERIAAHLQEAGIPRGIIETVVGSRGHQDQVGDAIRVLDLRIGSAPTDPRERERALGVLARRGYSLEIAYDAVRAFERR